MSRVESGLGRFKPKVQLRPKKRNEQIDTAPTVVLSPPAEPLASPLQRVIATEPALLRSPSPLAEQINGIDISVTREDEPLLSAPMDEGEAPSALEQLAAAAERAPRQPVEVPATRRQGRKRARRDVEEIESDPIDIQARSKPVKRTKRKTKAQRQAESATASIPATPRAASPSDSTRDGPPSTTESKQQGDGGTILDIAEALARQKGRVRAKTPPDAENTVVDPMHVKMENLCASDWKYGRLSTRAIQQKAEKKTLKQQQKENRLRQKELFAAGKASTSVPPTPSSSMPPRSPSAPVRGDEEEDDEEEEEDAEMNGDTAANGHSERFEESRYVPQIALDADGNMIVDTDSLERSRLQRQSTEDREVVDERQGNIRVTSATWGKRKACARWTPKDVEDLWEFLSMSGLDYQRIALWFGTYETRGVRVSRRSRQQVKKKLDKLAKLDPERWDACVYGHLRKPFDHERYQEITGVDPLADVQDPMAPFYKDLPGQERPSDATLEQQEAAAKEAAAQPSGADENVEINAVPPVESGAAQLVDVAAF